MARTASLLGLLSVLAGAGCQKVADCRPGTLFLHVALGPYTSATRLDVDVSVVGATVTPHTELKLDGRSTGGVEVDFPGGYPTRGPIDVRLTIFMDSTPLVSRFLVIDPAPGCTVANADFDVFGDAGQDAPPGGSGGSRTDGTGGATTGSGGAMGTGGATGSGGVDGIGGVPGAGGATSSGGSPGSGGTNGGTGGKGTGGVTCPVISDFSTWATGKGPLDIGKLAVNNFKGHTADAYGGAGYAWTFAYVGSLQFSKLTADTASNSKLISDFEPYASGSIAAPSNGSTTSVDDRAFGDLPLEIYMENGDARCRTLGLARADMQWASTTPDGYTNDVRWWDDDMYMITGLQVAAYRATGDAKYLTRSAKTMIAYLAMLQQADGLFWHTLQSHAYFGRGNGWIAAGMTELLLDLPAGSDRDAIMAGYTKQMDGLLNLQIAIGNDAGCWRQVLDVATANAETSCTAMFTFALATGVRNGWLTDPKYATAARNGWIALANKTNSGGQLDRVCPGTGQAPAGTLTSQQQFYMNITLGSNDTHGQAPLLWAARALLRPDCPGVR